MGDYRKLIAYQKAFQFALEIQSVSSLFPEDEKYGIRSQIRRSSKSVCAILAEAYTRRHQVKYFELKLGEIYGENAETQVWLDFAHACQYLQLSNYQKLTNQNQEIGRLIRYMLRYPEKFS
jgi:four helix bundle protein